MVVTAFPRIRAPSVSWCARVCAALAADTTDAMAGLGDATEVLLRAAGPMNGQPPIDTGASTSNSTSPSFACDHDIEISRSSTNSELSPYTGPPSTVAPPLHPRQWMKEEMSEGGKAVTHSFTTLLSMSVVIFPERVNLWSRMISPISIPSINR